MKLANSRISLRPLEREDLSLKVKWINDPEVHRFLNYEIPLCVARTEKWFEKALVNSTRRDFIVEVDSKAVGTIGLLGISLIHKTAEFYIAIGEKDYWGKGIGKEATSLLIDWAFINLNLHRIWGTYLSENQAMLKMTQKLGFSYEGRARKARFVAGKYVDVDYIGLLREEFTPCH